MKILEEAKGLNFLGNIVTIRSSMSEENKSQIKELAKILK